MSAALHHLLTLARVSNLPTVWSNCLAAWFISGAPPSLALVPLLIGASLLYAGGCTLNDAFDAKWDAQHRPERLIPSGRMSRLDVSVVGGSEMLAGVMILLLCRPSAAWPVLGLAACILLYDAWHKQSPLSVITMGACRWLLYVSAASVAGIYLHEAMICGGVVWLYIVVLSLVARGEAKRNAGASAWTRWLLLLVPLGIAAAMRAQPDLVKQLVDATLFRIGWKLPGYEYWLPPLVFSVGLAALLPWRSRNVGAWVNRLLAAIPVLDLALVLSVWRGVAADDNWLAVFPAAVLLSLLFQRWFKAT